MPSTASAWSDADVLREWASSGAMALTGFEAEEPLGPPRPLVPKLHDAAAVLRQRSQDLGWMVDVDPVGLLAERAAVAGLRRRGAVSCGGATRLLPCADGWVAVTLARDDDLELMPAWLESDVPPGEPWEAVADHVKERDAAAIEDRASLLGLPVSALPAAPPDASVAPPPLNPLPLRAQLVAAAPPTTQLASVVVIDLSALWAGPLCGSMLAAAGARVVKVESPRRPDGARRGPAEFFDLMNARKESAVVDLGADRGRALLHALVERADVVIEASRPRALENLGIDAVDILRRARPRVWVSITGHGRGGKSAHRVAFGDDAAVAGGLVVWYGGRPLFCADAVADPATGLVAAAAAFDALANGGKWLLDISMAGVSAHLAGPTVATQGAHQAALPRARSSIGRARPLGADTDAVLAAFDIDA